MSSEAFVTLAMNDGDALGALVLAQSIRQFDTKRNLVVLISNQLSGLIKFRFNFCIDRFENDISFRTNLEQIFNKVLDVDRLESNAYEELQLLSSPPVAIKFKKINCWLLEQYSKCVFINSNCLVLRSINDLFEKKEFSAAADTDWPDCFNSGVFVYRPSKETFDKTMLHSLVRFSLVFFTLIFLLFSLSGGDQDLLNSFVLDWHQKKLSQRLSFVYNVNINVFHSNSSFATR